eukprot:5764873-Karenia_brevis.AAC.1
MFGFSHGFMIYLWRTLVLPVGTYGMDVVVLSPDEERQFQKCEISCWRKLLGVGGRSPVDIINVLMHTTDTTTEARVKRAALFLRMLHSPINSWQQAALVTHHNLQTPWLKQVVDDLRL